MTLMDLKDYIKTNKPIPDDLIIFVCPENTFLASQYTKAICDAKGLEYVVSESIFEQMSAISLVLNSENILRVIRVEEFTEVAEDYSIFTNTVVICTKIDKKLESLLSEYIINIPKLEDWHLKAYIQQKCPTFYEEDLEWLLKNSHRNIYKIENELDKLMLFEEQSRYSIFHMWQTDPASDLYTFDVYELVAAIIQNNKSAVAQILKHRSCYKLELFSLVTLLLNRAKNALLATRGSGLTPQDIGIKDSQIYHLRREFAHMSDAELRSFIKKLSTIDLQVKSGLLDLTNSYQIDYVITSLMR